MARVRYSNTLPAKFSRAERRQNGIVHEADLRITSGGRLRLKLIVFSSLAMMRKWWKGRFRVGLRRRCLGAVAGISGSAYDPETDELRYHYYDRRYFAAIALCEGHINSVTVPHECVHVGFRYAQRVKRNPWLGKNDLDEEDVAYPAGEAFNAIVKSIRKAGVREV